MAIIDVGRVCKKTRGKEAGKYCAVIDKPEKGLVLVDGPNVKRKKVNVMHLEPLPVVLKIKKGAQRNTVVSALKKEGLVG